MTTTTPRKNTGLRAHLADNAVLVVVVSVCLVSAAFYFLMIRPDPSSHSGYVIANVVHTTGGDNADTTLLRLPDGTLHDIGSTSFALSDQQNDKVCLEKRTKPNGDVLYLKTRWSLCSEG